MQRLLDLGYIHAMMSGVARTARNDRDHELLGIALDHVTRLYDSRTGNGLQVLNYFLVAVAVLSAAYVSALNGKLHAVGCAIGLAGVPLSIVAYLVGRRQRDVARLAEIPMKEIQAILADSLDIGSLRMTEHADEQRKSWWRSSTHMANAIFVLAAMISVAAAVYAVLIRY
jgi:hypothetical protein